MGSPPDPAQAGYLLDTNILSDLILNPRGRARERLARVGEARVATSIVVACELRFGAAKRASAVLSERVEALLARLTLLPLEPGADRHYAQVRWHLERSGLPIGPNDLLIAAQALALGRTLVTDNTSEFSRVPGLVLENWLTDPLPTD